MLKKLKQGDNAHKLLLMAAYRLYKKATPL
jgi:hypothetical protein